MTSQGNLDHWWVSEQWLNDVSLSQYASKFREHLVDGRVLASLNRKELDKIMGIHDKGHQESLLCGIKLLKMFNFDVKVFFFDFLSLKQNKCMVAQLKEFHIKTVLVVEPALDFNLTYLQFTILLTLAKVRIFSTETW